MRNTLLHISEHHIRREHSGPLRSHLREHVRKPIQCDMVTLTLYPQLGSVGATSHPREQHATFITLTSCISGTTVNCYNDD